MGPDPSNLSRQIDRNALDNKLDRALSDIDGTYDSYLSFIELLKNANGSKVYTEAIANIDESKIYSATGSLEKLCTGSTAINGRNIFDSLLHFSDGDFMAMMRVGRIILHRIVNAQTVHAAHIFYASPPDLDEIEVKNAMEAASMRHALKPVRTPLKNGCATFRLSTKTR